MCIHVCVHVCRAAGGGADCIYVYAYMYVYMYMAAGGGADCGVRHVCDASPAGRRAAQAAQAARREDGTRPRLTPYARACWDVCACIRICTYTRSCTQVRAELDRLVELTDSCLALLNYTSGQYEREQQIRLALELDATPSAGERVAYPLG